MLIRISTLAPWRGERINDIAIPANVEDLWSDDELNAADLALVQPFVVPAGQQIVPGSTPTYAISGKQAVETYPTQTAPVERPRVRKSVVTQRLIDAGKIAAAYQALTSNPAYFARWFATDKPAVYADDPDALTLLNAIGADPAVIMAEDTGV